MKHNFIIAFGGGGVWLINDNVILLAIKDLLNFHVVYKLSNLHAIIEIWILTLQILIMVFLVILMTNAFWLVMIWFSEHFFKMTNKDLAIWHEFVLSGGLSHLNLSHSKHPSFLFIIFLMGFEINFGRKNTREQ